MMEEEEVVDLHNSNFFWPAPLDKNTIDWSGNATNTDCLPPPPNWEQEKISKNVNNHLGFF